MYFLRGKRLGLRPLSGEDLGRDYLAWLNDPEVNRYSGRRFRPQTEDGARAYLRGLGRDEQVLAVCVAESGRHIGNIKYGPVDWPCRCCEIEILLGDKSEWGKGYASEAIYLVTKFLFRVLGMNRVEAKSANPAFIKAVTAHLGWTLEGAMRQRYLAEDGYLDYHFMSVLASEFEAIEAYGN